MARRTRERARGTRWARTASRSRCGSGASWEAAAPSPPTRTARARPPARRTRAGWSSRPAAARTPPPAARTPPPLRSQYSTVQYTYPQSTVHVCCTNTLDTHNTRVNLNYSFVHSCFEYWLLDQHGLNTMLHWNFLGVPNELTLN